MLDLRELGADKAYNAYYIYEYARRHGIEPQIKLKVNAARSPTTGTRAKAYRAYVHQSRIDPEGYAAKANRRSNAETGNRAFKAFLGDHIYSTHPTAQRNEILCMAIAYNLTRLVVLSVEHGLEIKFAGGAQALADATWIDLGTLYDRMTVAGRRARNIRPTEASSEVAS
jgi:hypothetical protein